MNRKRIVRLVALLSLAMEVSAVWQRGWGLGGHVEVRCRDGHRFTTLWIPGVSVKALRLGWMRFQRCPVGHHWSIVVPVREGELTARQRRVARSRHDAPLP